MNNTKSYATPRSVFFFAVILATNKLITNAPLLYTANAGTGAPISALVSGLLILGIIWFFSYRLISDNNKNIFTFTETSNKPATFSTLIFGIFLVSYLFLDSVYILTETVGLLKAISFPESPLWFVAVFLVLGAICGAFGGYFNLLRISGFIAVFFLTVLTFLFFSVLIQSEATYLFPILGEGIQGITSGGTSGITLYSDILLLFLLKPENTSKKQMRNTVIIATAVGVLFTLLLTITYTAKIPYPISTQENFPIYLLLKEVYFGRFFQRIDAIFLLSSTLCQTLSLGLNLYLIFKTFKHVFNITSARTIIFPTAILLFSSIAGVISVSTNIISISAYFIFGLFAIWAFLPQKEVNRTYES